MPSKPDLPCAGCGVMMWRVSTSLPAGQARCWGCRRAQPTSGDYSQRYARVCEWCGGEYRRAQKIGRFCGYACAGAWDSARRRAVSRSADYRLSRAERERKAPGLSKSARSALLHKWVRQGRACLYCGVRLATTIDHVVPLVLGGTNFEGNLVPCCKSCNSSKSGWLLVEWGGLRNGSQCASY